MKKKLFENVEGNMFKMKTNEDSHSGMNAEAIYEVLMSGEFKAWYDDAIQEYLQSGLQTKEQMIEKIKELFKLGN